MVRVVLVCDTRVFPPSGRRPAHPHGAAGAAAYKIEGPFGVLFFTLVAEEWSISKADGEPADFGHDMERHQEVENDRKYARLADERSGIAVTCHLDILIIKVVEKREVLFVAVADCRHSRGRRVASQHHQHFDYGPSNGFLMLHFPDEGI